MGGGIVCEGLLFPDETRIGDPVSVVPKGVAGAVPWSPQTLFA